MLPPGAEGAVPPPRSRRRGAAVMLVGGWANLLLLVVQGLVLVPLYLRHLGPGMYGAWVASGDVLGWLAVLDLGVTGIGLQRMAAAHGRGDARGAAGWYGTAMLVQAALAAVLAGTAVLLAPQVAGWVGTGGAGDAELAGAFAVAGVAAGLGLLANGAGTLALAVQRPLFVNAATFAAGVAGIVVTLVLLGDGRGVWALALGMLARAALLLAACGAHAAWLLWRDLRTRVHLRGAAARELARLSPVSLLTLAGNAAAGRSDALLVALFFGPRTVAAYVLTRRAAELLAMFLARLGGAVYPGFAHLVGSGEHARAASVLGDVRRLYLWTAVPGVALYMALNRTFVEVWVGPAEYAGHALTVLIGLNVLAVGWSSLVLYVNGAAGNIERAGVAVFVEAVARVAVALALLRWWGIGGLPAAGIATTALSAEVGMRWLRERLRQPRPALAPRAIAAAAVLLALGAAAGTVRWAGSWAGLVGWGIVFTGVAALGVLGGDPGARAAILRLAARRRPAEAAS
ncbi:MAG TPA: oligosaccharide flippase family protein [Longimicrobium sp.]|nr:oligosaccharide flippase family protein [Longimicrobium sp.]